MGYRDLNKCQIPAHPGLNLGQMPGGEWALLDLTHTSVLKACVTPGGTWSSFAGYVPLASQNPYPIYSLILWPTIDRILVTFGQMSL